MIPSLSTWSSNGLDREITVKKFELYKGWKDPDLKKRPRKRSIPNKIKRFIDDLKGNIPQYEECKKEVPRWTTMEFSSSFNLSSMTSEFIPKIVQCDAVGLKQKKRKSSDICKPAGGVVRCAVCDYPYDSTKRRKPPHLFTPTVVLYPVHPKNRSYTALKSEISGYLSFAGLAKAKTTRLKRRRSSTELYAGLVAVAPVRLE